MAPHIPEFQGSFFALEIDKVKIALFTACSGISVEFDVVEQQHVSTAGAHSVQKIPGGLAKYGEVVMKRGLTANKDLQAWFDDIANASKEVERSTGVIMVLDRQMKPVAKFNFEAMWPTKLTVGDLSAGSTEVLIEELTLAHEGLEWA